MKNRETGDFTSLSEFLSKTRRVLVEGKSDTRIDLLREKAMAAGSDSTGGVLVPPKFADEIFLTTLEESIVWKRAIIMPLKTDKVSIARLVDSDRSSNIFGGVAFTFLEEGGNKSTGVADPAVGAVELSAKEGVASCWVTNRLMDDAENFAGFIKFAFGKAIAFYGDYSFINGLGSNQPLGVLGSDALIEAARTADSKVDMPDIQAMAARLLPGSWQKAVWLINQEVLTYWMSLTSVLNLADMKMLGCDVIVTEKCPALNSAGDVLLADFSHYVIANRELIIDASAHVPDYWQKNTTFWKAQIRVDGQPTLTAAITPKNGSSTVSPFVALEAGA